jgi:hypothetical protein
MLGCASNINQFGMRMEHKILISINTSWNILHFRRSLIVRLQAEGYRIETAAPPDASTPALAALVQRHHDLPMQNDGTSPLQDALLWLRYVRLLARSKPNVMLTYTIKPNIYGSLAAACLGVKVIANVSGLGTAFIRRNWLTWVAMRLYRLAFTFYTSCVFSKCPRPRLVFDA